MNRRTLVRGAAWSIPVIAVAAAAPAFAASCTSLYSGSLAWNSANYTRASNTAGTGTIPLGGPGGTVGLTLASTFNNYTPSTTGTDATPNLGVTASVGATGQAGLTMVQVANSAAVSNNPLNNQTLKFTFDRPVYNVVMTLTDIDSNTAQYIDGVAVLGATFGFAFPIGSTVSGSGTVAAPFRQANPALPYDNVTSPGGNVTLTFPGPLTTFSIQYWNLLAPGSITVTPIRQSIFMASMSLAAYNAGCP